MSKRAIYRKNKQAVAKQRLIENPDRLPGRPTEFDPGVCDAIIEKKLNEGYTDSEIMAYLGISRGTFYNWKEKYTEFNDALEIGKAAEEAWFDKVGKLGMLGQVRNFNSTTWINMKKNLHGWDKPAAGNEVNVNINQVNLLKSKSLDQLMLSAADQLQRLIELNPAIVEELKQEKIQAIYDHNETRTD